MTNKSMNKKLKTIGLLACVFAVCFVSVGYAVVQDNLTVSGSVAFAAQVTDVIKTNEDLKNAIDAKIDYTVYDNGETYTRAIVADGNNVTVDDAVVNINDVAFTVKNGGTMIINDANVTTYPNAATGTVSITGGSTLIINGGTYGRWLVAMGDSSSTLEIHGGTFECEYINGYSGFLRLVGTVKIYGGSFKCNPSAYLADGYIAEKNADGYWVVKKDVEDEVIIGGIVDIWESETSVDFSIVEMTPCYESDSDEDVLLRIKYAAENSDSEGTMQYLPPLDKIESFPEVNPEYAEAYEAFLNEFSAAIGSYDTDTDAIVNFYSPIVNETGNDKAESMAAWATIYDMGVHEINMLTVNGFSEGCGNVTVYSEFPTGYTTEDIVQVIVTFPGSEEENKNIILHAKVLETADGDTVIKYVLPEVLVMRAQTEPAMITVVHFTVKQVAE